MMKIVYGIECRRDNFVSLQVTQTILDAIGNPKDSGFKTLVALLVSTRRLIMSLCVNATPCKQVRRILLVGSSYPE